MTYQLIATATPGKEILGGPAPMFHYYKGRAAKYGVAEFVKLNHRVTSATWDDGKGKWIMEITNLTSGATVTDEAEIFINAAGFLKYVSIFKGK